MYSVRYSVIMLLMGLLAITNTASAQLLDKPVSFHCRKLPLSEALDSLSNLTGAVFFYSSDQINSKKKVSVQLNNQTLQSVLRVLIDDGRVEFTETNNKIVISVNKLKKFTFSGLVTDKQTGEVLIGVTVFVQRKNGPPVYTQSNSYGFYSITLPADTLSLFASYLGYKTQSQRFVLNNNSTIAIQLEPMVLDELEIVGKENAQPTNMHHIEINLGQIDHIPAILNEKDAVRYTMLMPGVQKGSEGNGYLYVRGGGPEQNLILLDDAVIYNANHLLGLNTIFSGSELKKAELTKGAFSPRFSGRLSSVLDLRLKDGNMRKLSGELSTGFISSKLMLEGPIVKDRSSFLVSFRRGYLGAASQLVVNQKDQDPLHYSNYDFHAKASCYIGTKDRLMFSTYLGQDILGEEYPGTKTETNNLMKWGNSVFSTKWNHYFSNKLFSNLTLVYSKYSASFVMGDNVTAAELNADIEDKGIKLDLDYMPHASHSIKTGVSFTAHRFAPVILGRTNDGLTTTTNKVTYNETGYESGIYAEDNWKITSSATVALGLRASTFQIDKTSYLRIEPRINYQYEIKPGLVANASYSLMNQYLHMVSSAGLGIQYDVWLPSSESLKPLRSNLITLGITKNNFWKGQLLIGMEAYYKQIENQVLFKDGSNFLSLIPFAPNQPLLDWETILTQGTCKAYGIEWLVKKEGKKWNGWVSYTLSKTMMQFDDINRGREFPAFYDRRHDIGIVTEWKPSKRWTLSSTWVFGSGYAITMPTSRYYTTKHTPGQPIPASGFGYIGLFDIFPAYNYDDKNGYRMIDYHKLDVAVQYHFNIGKKIKGDLLLSVFNVYNRNNAFQYNIANLNDESGNQALFMSSLFPIIPSLSLTLKF